MGFIKNGYGHRKLIPNKIIAATAIESVAILVLFGVIWGVALN